MKHLNIYVYGKVQGVFFRHHTNLKAQALGLKGFVKNQDDGSVYIEVEGKENLLQDFLEWCKYGPDAASVDRVDVQKGVVQSFSTFEILYK